MWVWTSMLRSYRKTFGTVLCLCLTIVITSAFDCNRCNPHGMKETCINTNSSCTCSKGYTGADCYTCNIGFYKTSNSTCAPCMCNKYSTIQNKTCDVETGQCPCKKHVIGYHCSECEEGFEANRLTNGALFSCECKRTYKYNVSSERCEKDKQCFCHNHSDKCDEETNACLNCTSNTMGKRCEKCKFNFYGDARTGRPDTCKPCPPCNDKFATGSCHLENRKPVCDCNIGHTGENCENCALGFHRLSPESRCLKCACSGNLDPQKTNSCDPVTGECLHCTPNTTGKFCEKCAEGFHGDAVNGVCRKIIMADQKADEGSNNQAQYIILGITVPLGIALITFGIIMVYNFNCKNKQRRKLPFWTVEFSSPQEDPMVFSLLDAATDSPYAPVFSDIEDQVNDALDKAGYIDEGHL